MLFVQVALIYRFESPPLLLLTPAAERTEERKLEEELMEAAREGDLSTLTQLVSGR